MPTVPFRVEALGPGDARRLRALLDMFGAAFEDPQSYRSAQPDDAYLAQLLGRDTFIALAAPDGDAVVGGIAADVLPKFEQARSEIDIDDLAVDVAHRHRGIAEAVIETLRCVARERGTDVIFVQADRGDDAAIALYAKQWRREDVLHFDIDPAPA